MAMKILKDAGVVPPEVEMMQAAAALDITGTFVMWRMLRSI